MTQETSRLMSSDQKEVAFYYPGPFWYSAAWVKNLLLFFDGLALLVPEYMADRPEILEPEMAIPLREAGLLHILKPEDLVDKGATEQLATALTDIITSGALDPLTKKPSKFQELSWSRLGGYGDEGLARMILEELKTRRLATDTQDGLSIPMHPMVRSLVLVLLAQILRPQGEKYGFDLSPATDRPELVDALTEILSLEAAPSSGHVVSLDLTAVGVDLSDIPLDEVLSFRADNLVLHRKYAQGVRRFVRDLSLVPAGRDRRQLMVDRQEEIKSLKTEVLRASKRAWKRPDARFALGIAGAAWSVHTGNVVGAALGVGGAILALRGHEKTETGAYSFLFRAHERYRRRTDVIVVGAEV
jgi:hypothetical protein